jgi:hypothetical protein
MKGNMIWSGATKSRCARSISTDAALGFNSDKGLDAFAADARNLNLPTSVDWLKRGDAEAALAKAATTFQPRNKIFGCGPHGAAPRAVLGLLALPIGLACLYLCPSSADSSPLLPHLIFGTDKQD